MTYRPVHTQAATFMACVGTPGYVPMTAEGGFATIAEAWAFLANERERDIVMSSDDGIWQDRTYVELTLHADPENDAPCESVYGPTPGGSEHDLGLFYEVMPEVEESEQP